MFEFKIFCIEQLKKIEVLLQQNREYYFIDLHIHTEYSADGTTTVQQVIDRSVAKGFDIISITDHDSIKAYTELVGNHSICIPNCLVVIPGIEFSVSYPAYEERCHVLKYFYNPCNLQFQDNLLKNEQAYWNRAKIQFERLQKNECIQYFLKKHNLHISLEGYQSFLKDSIVKIPEYDTLAAYIFSLLGSKGVSNWEIYYKLVEVNEKDLCDTRKQLRREALERFYKKNGNKEISYNIRKLRTLLAPIGIDDDDFGMYPPSGSLSVNEYGQVKIDDLVNTGVNILAHPNKKRISCVEMLTNIVSGLELNMRSPESLNELVNRKSENMNLLVTKGSDSHSCDEFSYDNMSLYKMKRQDLIRFYNCAKEQF